MFFRALLAAAAVSMLAGAALAQPPPPGPAPLTYMQPLTPAAIQLVQTRLRQAGSYTGPSDGVWGADSAAALSQYQQTHGLQVTGQMNQGSAVLLGLTPAELLGPAPTAASPVTPPGTTLSRAAVLNLQTRLRTLGYYTGGIDGAWGPAAMSALKRFQQASGIEVSGRINPQTVTAMGLNPNDLTAPAP